MSTKDETSTQTKGETSTVLESAQRSTTTNYDATRSSGRNEDDETGGVILIRPDGP